MDTRSPDKTLALLWLRRNHAFAAGHSLPRPIRATPLGGLGYQPPGAQAAGMVSSGSGQYMIGYPIQPTVPAVKKRLDIPGSSSARVYSPAGHLERIQLSVGSSGVPASSL